jgi:S1-C subfamily serine protease
MNAASSLALLAILSVPNDGTPRGPAIDSAVLLQFSSQRCTHCQSMQPIIAQLARQGVNVQVIDVDQQLNVAQQFQVPGVPTFVALSGGRETGRIVGVTSYEKLAALAMGAGASGHVPGVRSQEPGGQRQSLQATDFRAGAEGLSPEQIARAATVRIKVEDATGYGFGTGTIIDTHEKEALVVTCGHLFRESKGEGKVTADLFASGAVQTVDGQLIAYDLDRDIALVSIRAGSAMRAAVVAPPGFTVRPGDRAFTIGCDKGADPSVRATQIKAVNKYKGKPNYTAAGQPIDGRSGGGLFSVEGYLIGICNAADPADDEGLYAGLASIHWQLDQIGQSEIYQRAAKVAAANPPRDIGVALASAQLPPAATGTAPQLSPQMPAGPFGDGAASQFGAPSQFGSVGASPSPLAPVAAAGDDTEIVFIVRSKRDPAQRSEVYVVDQAPPDLLARISHAARTSGEQRAALARVAQPMAAAALASPLPGTPRVVRGQSTDY